MSGTEERVLRSRKEGLETTVGKVSEGKAEKRRGIGKGEAGEREVNEVGMAHD